MRAAWRLFAGMSLLGLLVSLAAAADWPRFRGPNGSGVTADKAPTQWGEQEHIQWKIELPGRGVSAPIVVGEKVFVTCYSGYGVTRGEGQIEDLKRHLVCVDRNNGTVLWTATVPVELPEDPYEGAGVPAHGYASHTPVSDGERVYVFFGKSGALAYDMQGNELWRRNLGKESGRMRWGSAASPILVGELVIVNASDESEALVGLDQKTGEEKWRAEAAGLANTWGTPVLAETNGEQEIVLAVPHEIWGFNPATGKLKWYTRGTNDDSMSASAVLDEGMIYALGGRGGNSVAIRPGGKGDVDATHVAWEGQASGRFGSPVIYNGNIYVNNGALAYCYDAKTGDRVYQSRLDGEAGAAPAEQPGRGPGGPPNGGPQGGGAGGAPGAPPGGGRGFGRGGGGGDYASPIIADGKLYMTLKSGKVYVAAAKPEFELLATNDLSSDTSGFDATPAVSNGQLFIRSHKFLYCIGE